MRARARECVCACWCSYVKLPAFLCVRMPDRLLTAGDGKLSHKEFVAIMKQRARRGVVEHVRSTAWLVHGRALRCGSLTPARLFAANGRQPHVELFPRSHAVRARPRRRRQLVSIGSRVRTGRKRPALCVSAVRQCVMYRESTRPFPWAAIPSDGACQHTQSQRLR